MGMGSKYNIPHLEKGDREVSVDPAKLTIFNMRFCPFGERVMYNAIAKGIEYVNYVKFVFIFTIGCQLQPMVYKCSFVSSSSSFSSSFFVKTKRSGSLN